MDVGKAFLLTLLMVTDWAAAQSAPAPAAPAINLFAPTDQCGQVLALSVDDAGRVYTAVTARSWGRGTVSPLGDPAMTVQDRALRSVAARERLVTGWLGSGRLGSLLKQRNTFFPSGDGETAHLLTKYSESVGWLSDVNHDGMAESSTLVADAFRDPMDGPGSALLALAGGRWFYGCAPHLWQLEDRNNDQVAEERRPVAGGFGLRNDPWGGDLHALLEAPDGWIYFTMGERGYALREADGTPLRGLGSGAVFRCRPDGTGLERVASGMHNPTALAMLPDGQLLAVDDAVPGGKARLLLVIPGADFGWQAEAVSGPGQGLWFDEGMETAVLDGQPGDGQPLWCLPALTPLEAPCAALELLADGTLLAADPRGNGQGGLVRWTPAWNGALYQFKNQQEIWRGGAVVALAQSPSGPVYFADWGEAVGVQGRCQVRRLMWPAPAGKEPAAGVTGPVELAETLIQGLPDRSIRELKGLLDHPAPRVALRARQRLERMSFQDSMEALLQVARRGPGLRARLQGLRGAGAVARADPALLNELTPFLNDPDPVLRAAAATLLGEGALTDAPPALRRALWDEALPVRLAAAAAIARLHPPTILADLMEAASRNTQHLPLIRCSLAHAMARSVPATALAEAASVHASPEARLTVVHALRRTSAQELAAFLTDADPTVAAEAARAVYDLPVRPAFTALAAMLDPPAAGRSPFGEAVGRRAIAAAAYLGTSVEANRLARFARAPDTPSTLSLLALATLARWDQPTLEDPIWKRPETVLPRLPGLAREAARQAAEALITGIDAAVATEAKHLTEAPAMARQDIPSRLAVLNDSKAPEPQRLSALLDLIAADALTIDTAKTLTTPTVIATPPSLRAEARSFLMRRDPKAGALLTREALNSGSLQEKQAAIRTLDHLPGHGGENEKFILELTKKLGSGTIEAGIQVEVIEALQRRDTESRSPWRKSTEAWQASLSTHSDAIAPWRMTLAGGDPAAGRMVFETHAEANCLSCHSVGGTGGVIGPDLDGVADRQSPEGLLESLTHPGATLVPGYESHPDGATGLNGEMPPMGTILTLREIRDLLAFLYTLKGT